MDHLSRSPSSGNRILKEMPRGILGHLSLQERLTVSLDLSQDNCLERLSEREEGIENQCSGFGDLRRGGRVGEQA